MKKVLMIITFFTMLWLFNSKVMAYKEYKIGDIIEYNEANYYVIKNSSTKDNSVVMLKAEPLTYEEIQTYSAGTGAEANNNNGYGQIRYHSSSNNYETSYVKTTVDAWKSAKAPSATEARLITYEELLPNLGYDWQITSGGYGVSPSANKNVPIWVYNINYNYWTMSAVEDSDSYVWFVDSDGSLRSDVSVSYTSAVRPVIVLKKDNLLNIEEKTNDSDNIINSTDSENISNSDNSKKNTDDYSEIVYVDNTASKKSVIIILIGFLLAGVGIVTYYTVCKKIERK